jgi:hypothetical protein
VNRSAAEDRASAGSAAHRQSPQPPRPPRLPTRTRPQPHRKDATPTAHPQPPRLKVVRPAGNPHLFGRLGDSGQAGQSGALEISPMSCSATNSSSSRQEGCRSACSRGCRGQHPVEPGRGRLFTGGLRHPGAAEASRLSAPRQTDGITGKLEVFGLFLRILSVSNRADERADMAVQLAEERNEQHRPDDDRRTSRSARGA